MKIKDGFVVREIAGITYAVATGKRSKEFSGMLRLTPTGEFIWNELSSDKTIEQLVEKVTSEYEVDAATAKADIEAFLEKLAEANVLEG